MKIKKITYKNKVGEEFVKHFIEVEGMLIAFTIINWAKFEKSSLDIIKEEAYYEKGELKFK